MCRAEWPDLVCAGWVVAVCVGWTWGYGADRSAPLAGVGQGAIVGWALDDLVRGASPFRRLLGVVVLAGQLVRLLA